MGVGGEVVGPGISGTGSGGGGGSGTVTRVSVATAKGFAGTVANATTTPAITVQTSITGITKGNGTALSAATAGTDYPATGVISAGGPTGSATVVPVITWNANGQLTAVTMATIAPAILPSALTLSTIVADPNPAVVGTYYRCNYTGNLTLPTGPATGSWVMAKVIGAHTLTIVGTVDGTVNPTATQNVNNWMVYNGTNWDFI